MVIGKRAAVLAAAALVGTAAMTRAVRADVPPVTPPVQDELTLTRPVFLDDEPPKPDKPLAHVMKGAGVDSSKYGVNIYGFVEGSYTYSFDPPAGDFLAGRVFDIDNEEVLLNQADLSIEKTVDSAAAAKDGRWDFGGKVEMIYGNDARFIHANGLNFYGSSTPQLSPDNQFDPVQAYVDIAAPLGKGLLIRAGKMVTHMGYETINPTTNPFYSHTYLFGYAIPFTHTGVMAFYNLTDKATIMGGFSRGWDQSLEDNNGQLDYLGQLKYVFNDKTTAYVNFVTGPEAATNNAWRTVIDGILTYQATDALSFAANGDFGIEPLAGAGGSTAQWYGFALYSGYKLSDMFTANIRGEWFADPQGARGLGGNEYEATVGLAIHPFPKDDLGSNLVVRPELRYDYSDNHIFDGGAKFDQWTAAIDAIFTF